MEYADGGYLGSAYRSQVIVSSNTTDYLDHFQDILSGLKTAHSLGVIHRDIKPQNLLWYRRRNRVKIADFGVAKNLEKSNMAPNYLVGSLPYVAPECFNMATEESPQRDIYALGCTFYELLTGERAFGPKIGKVGGHDINAYANYHNQSERPDAVLKAREYVSLGLSQIIKDMIAIDPYDRPSIDEVINVIQQEQSIRDKGAILEERIESIKLTPSQPKIADGHLVNPKFRLQRLNESLFFVFLSMPHRTPSRLKKLFGALEIAFGDTYSICELFGRHDYVIRVWAPVNRAKITEFCRNLMENALDGGELRLMSCEEARYLTYDKVSVRKDLNELEVLIKLNEAQNGNGASKSAIDWLKKERIYLGSPIEAPSHGQIQCFTRIAYRDGTARGIQREADMALICERLHEKLIAGKENPLPVNVYRRGQRGEDGIEPEESDFIIAYVADNYTNVVDVPSLVLEEVSGHYRFRTSTCLASRRHFVDSDRVLLPGLSSQ